MNMIQSAKQQVAELTQSAYEACVTEGFLPAGFEIQGTIEIPKETSNGDYASSFAMAGAKSLKMAPRKIAQLILEHMNLENTYFSRAEMAGPGFLNFFLSDKWYTDLMTNIEQEGKDYGRSNIGQGQRVMVEFVSANPTGPMHIGNARGGVLGDTLSEVLEWTGYQVWREFYVNDAGNQIHKFAESLNARYLQQILGADAVPFPENGYQGEDITDLAKLFLEENGPAWKDRPEQERLDALAKFGLEKNIPRMQEDLRRYKITYDQWFYESSLHESGYVAETVAMLANKGWTYEKDGALWLQTSKLLEQKLLKEGKTPAQIEKLELKDDVLRRSNGFYTYFAADIAYHRNKFEARGFEKVINVWGADHHGHVARLQAALDGLGLDGSNRLIVVLMQLVNLLQDGQPVRMSKRSGKAISLRNLLDEIDVNAARYFFNCRVSTSPLDFDLDLAVREDSENPVYYVQYAHARICSLILNLGQPVPPVSQISVSLLSTEVERDLMKCLAQWPEEIRLAARDYDPSRINRYLIQLAGDFHRFYNTNRIKSEAQDLLQARLKLADTVRSVIASGLNLLGVTAPEKM